ncbi:MAG TPA: hypothetical protein VFN76_04245, partial [Candidatus Limnocylindria bacterium]|nr:hypothetical protein [Candidatus Limnocylindria bacterium]
MGGVDRRRLLIGRRPFDIVEDPPDRRHIRAAAIHCRFKRADLIDREIETNLIRDAAALLAEMIREALPAGMDRLGLFGGTLGSFLGPDRRLVEERMCLDPHACLDLQRI